MYRTITSRAARLGWDFARGETISIRQVEQRFGMSRIGAYLLLCRVSDLSLWFTNQEERQRFEGHLALLTDALSITRQWMRLASLS